MPPADRSRFTHFAATAGESHPLFKFTPPRGDGCVLEPVAPEADMLAANRDTAATFRRDEGPGLPLAPERIAVVIGQAAVTDGVGASLCVGERSMKHRPVSR